MKATMWKDQKEVKSQNSLICFFYLDEYLGQLTMCFCYDMWEYEFLQFVITNMDLCFIIQIENILLKTILNLTGILERMNLSNYRF